MVLKWNILENELIQKYRESEFHQPSRALTIIWIEASTWNIVVDVLRIKISKSWHMQCYFS